MGENGNGDGRETVWKYETSLDPDSQKSALLLGVAGMAGRERSTQRLVRNPPYFELKLVGVTRRLVPRLPIVTSDQRRGQ